MEAGPWFSCKPKEIAMIHLSIPKMACGGCASGVTKAILALDPDARVDTSTERREVTVDTVSNQAQVQSALAEAGYPSTPVA
ncbi:MAG TPA: heavy metal transport/detoxification protein [Brevundimonas sp.]|nr:heavy metal transport/detoxification protein [Brevundimonas sp.]